MPNYVKTQVEFFNTPIERQREIIIDNFNNDNELDFSILVPMPKELDIERSTYTSIGLMLVGGEEFKKNTYMKKEDAQERFDQFDKKTQKNIMTLGKQAVSNYEKYGVIDWYDFSNEKWGTKWNACDTYIEDLDYSTIKSKEDLIEQLNNLQNITLVFRTAWSFPIPWFNTFIEKYNDIETEVKYADEDTGNNCGIFYFSNGELDSQETDSSTPESRNWTEFAFRFWYGDEDKEAYGYNSDWEYEEGVEERYYEKQRIKNKLENFD